MREWLEELWLISWRKCNLYSYRAGFRYADRCLRSRMLRPAIHLENHLRCLPWMNDWYPFDSGIRERLEMEGLPN